MIPLVDEQFETSLTMQIMTTVRSVILIYMEPNQYIFFYHEQLRDLSDEYLSILNS